MYFLKFSPEYTGINKKIINVLVSVFLVFALSLSASAFADYEKDVSKELYSDLDQKYEINDFSSESLEYKTLKKLENNVTKKGFKNSEFKVHHVEDEMINAYYIGNGNIMLFEGLLDQLNTEDQLAGLIAHEMGHGIEKHMTEDMRRNTGLTVLNLLFNHFTDNEYQTVTNIAHNLINNGFSREQEEEADKYAVDLMLRSGYDPQGLIALMRIFKENSNNPRFLEFMQTHPAPESRIEYLEEYIAEKKSDS